MNVVTVVINFKDYPNTSQKFQSNYTIENIYGENNLLTLKPLNNIFKSYKIYIWYIMGSFSLGKLNQLSIDDVPKNENGESFNDIYILNEYLKSNENNKRIYISI